MKQAISIFNNKYFKSSLSLIMLLLTVSLGMALMDVSTGFNEEIKRMSNKMYYEVNQNNLKYYHDDVELIDEDTAMSKLINCYKTPIENDKLNDKIKETINEIYKLYNSDSQYFSFIYKDLYTSFTVSYNEDSPIFTASSIKAPAMIYLYEQASLGKVDLNERLTYTSNFYHGGSGILQTKPTNTTYTVEELIEYTIHDSDNIAYAMLMDRFKRENILSFWQTKNTQNIFTMDTIWGAASAKDASIYMQELYDFSLNNKEYGQALLKKFKNADWKMITNKDGEYKTANKGGWSGKAIHDIAIVFDKNPYIIAVYSNCGENGNYNYIFKKTSALIGKLHEEYWKEKETTCNSIKQY